MLKKSATFMSVSRCETTIEKNITKGKGYNDDIIYNPKYSFVEKQVPRPIKYGKKIPFCDSRFDIFYGQDKKYTQQMLLEDEAAGGQYSLINKDNRHDCSVDDSLYLDEHEANLNPKSKKRLKTLQKLYLSYHQSQKH